MPVPNLGPAYDYAQRIERIERQLQLLGSSQFGQAFSAKQSDGSPGVIIQQRLDTGGATSLTTYQGPDTPRDPNTGLHQALLYIGQLVSGGHPVGAGLLLYRPNGVQIMSAGAGGFGLSDAAGNLLVSPDETSGQGLGRPYLPLPLPQPLGTSLWPGTSSTTWAGIAQANVYFQHPRVRWQATVYCPGTTAGNVQLVLPGGTALGAVHACPAGGFTNIDETVAVPSYVFLQSSAVVVNVQVTAGTGQVQVQSFGLYGVQS